MPERIFNSPADYGSRETCFSDVIVLSNRERIFAKTSLAGRAPYDGEHFSMLRDLFHTPVVMIVFNLFIQGARAVLQHRTKQEPGLSEWLAKLASRTHHNVVAVALANKLARIAWAVLAKEERYLPRIFGAKCND